MMTNSRIIVVTQTQKTQKRTTSPAPQISAISLLEIAHAFLYSPTMKKRSGGPQTAKGKAVTRLNAARHGIYSVTPVLPNVERQACAEPAEVPAGSPTASASSKTPVRRLRGEYTCCMYKKLPKLPNEFNLSSKGGVDYRGGLLVPGAIAGTAGRPDRPAS